MAFLAALAIIPFLGAPVQAGLEQQIATFDQLTSGYGVMTMGNATVGGNYGDTQGGIAVGGNLTISGGDSQWAEHSSAGSKPTFYVAGQLNLTGNQEIRIKNGYAYLPNATGTWNAADKRLTLSSGGKVYTGGSSDPLAGTDPRSTSGGAPWNWAALNSSLVNVSNALAAASSTGTIGVSGQNMTFNTNGQTSGVAVFTLDGSKFQGTIYDANGDGVFDQNNERISNFAVNIPADMVYVINVVNFGGKTLLDGINTNTDTDSNSRLLWNIIPSNGNTGTVTLGKDGSTFNGSVLAPLVDVKNNNGTATNGQIIAGSYTHNGGELHYTEFSAPVSFSAVPEPGTWGLFGIAGCAVMMAMRRNRRRRA
ncbi:collagen-binding domain-containing protein [Rariglobus hedericola]|nr:collagen-binding domain-containing protein [Rariglobus hedericola]